MSDLQDLRKFPEEYKEYAVQILEPVHKEIMSLFFQWTGPDYWNKHALPTRLPTPSPVQRVDSRIKRPESVLDKISRKGDHFPEGVSPRSFRRMTDTIGVRAIVHFLSDFPLVDRELRMNKQIEISKEHLPVAYLRPDIIKRLGLTHLKPGEKESGYASIHYILRVKTDSVPQDDNPWFELEVRTLPEDTWATIEHILGYKPSKRTSASIQRQFRIISQLLTAIDEHFDLLNEDLMRFQREVAIDDSDNLTPENLPAVLAEFGIGCAQREIDGLLKVLASRHVENVGSLRTLSTPSRLQTITSTFLAEEGRLPTNFEIVAHLANLLGCPEGGTEQIERIKLQLEIQKIWHGLKERDGD